MSLMSVLPPARSGRLHCSGSPGPDPHSCRIRLPRKTMLERCPGLLVAPRLAPSRRARQSVGRSGPPGTRQRRSRSHRPAPCRSAAQSRSGCSCVYLLRVRHPGLCLPGAILNVTACGVNGGVYAPPPTRRSESDLLELVSEPGAGHLAALNYVLDAVLVLSHGPAPLVCGRGCRSCLRGGLPRGLGIRRANLHPTLRPSPRAERRQGRWRGCPAGQARTHPCPLPGKPAPSPRRRRGHRAAASSAGSSRAGGRTLRAPLGAPAPPPRPAARRLPGPSPAGGSSGPGTGRRTPRSPAPTRSGQRGQSADRSQLWCRCGDDVIPNSWRYAVPQHLSFVRHTDPCQVDPVQLLQLRYLDRPQVLLPVIVVLGDLERRPVQMTRDLLRAGYLLLVVRDDVLDHVGRVGPVRHEHDLLEQHARGELRRVAVPLHPEQLHARVRLAWRARPDEVELVVMVDEVLVRVSDDHCVVRPELLIRGGDLRVGLDRRYLVVVAPLSPVASDACVEVQDPHGFSSRATSEATGLSG